MRRMQPEDDAQAAELYQELGSYKAVAQALAWSDKSIRDAIRRNQARVEAGQKLRPLEQRQISAKAWAALSDRERAVCELRWGSEAWTLAEVATELGISRQRAHQLEHAAARKLGVARG